MIYSRNLKALLAHWQITPLHSLSTLMHKLGFEEVFMSAAEAAMVGRWTVLICQSAFDRQWALDLIDWSGQVCFAQLEALVVRWTAEHMDGTCLLSELSQPALVKVAALLQKQASW